MIMNKKGQANLSAMVIGIIMSVVISAIIVYTVFFPTMKGSNTVSAIPITDESHTFVNNTYQDFAVQANCLSASLYPDTCGVQSIQAVWNATSGGTLASTSYDFTSSQIKIYTNATTKAGAYSVNYTYNDFDVFPTSQISNYNTVLLLGGVIVIIVAIIGFMMLVRLVA